jgi:hypothetical protein
MTTPSTPAASSFAGESTVSTPGTDRVCVLQQRLADRLRASSGTRVLELPVAVPDLAQAVWWHPARAFDPGHRWLQQLFRDAADTLDDLGPVPPPGPAAV